MLRIQPFRAIRPRPEFAARVASLPYDVVTTEEARALAADNPLSFLHVVRSEIDLPPRSDPYSELVYQKARENFDRMRSDGTFLQDEEPGLLIYRQTQGERTQVGLVCCCHVDDYARNVIKKHEKTRQQKEDDRTKHVLALNANAGPVFLTYRDDAAINALMERDMQAQPLYDFTAVDGVTHTAWTVADPDPYVESFRALSGGGGGAYVADGHHRAASAARASAIRRDANPNHTGEEEYNWFLAALFPASQLNILPYNRVIIDLADMTKADVLARLAEVGSLSRAASPTPDRRGVFCIFIDNDWHRLELDPASIDQRDPIASLDVALLQDRILTPIFNIGDPRTDPRIDFVGGIRGTAELERLVRIGTAALGISMFPTSIEQLLEVSDADLIMPPKSTWFEPKLRSGLFVHLLD